MCKYVSLRNIGGGQYENVTFRYIGGGWSKRPKLTLHDFRTTPNVLDQNNCFSYHKIVYLKSIGGGILDMAQMLGMP